MIFRSNVQSSLFAVLFARHMALCFGTLLVGLAFAGDGAHGRRPLLSTVSCGDPEELRFNILDLPNVQPRHETRQSSTSFGAIFVFLSDTSDASLEMAELEIPAFKHSAHKNMDYVSRQPIPHSLIAATPS